MPTIGERNAARAQRNAERNAVIQQDNARNNARNMEDRVRELEARNDLLEDRVREMEARNDLLESRVQAMGDVFARQILAQQQVQPLPAVNQNHELVVMDSAAGGIGIGRLAKVSIRKSPDH